MKNDVISPFLNLIKQRVIQKLSYFQAEPLLVLKTQRRNYAAAVNLW